ncbi:MAG: hypothetical protein ACK559_27880, partial [bacterium]
SHAFVCQSHQREAWNGCIGQPRDDEITRPERAIRFNPSPADRVGRALFKGMPPNQPPPVSEAEDRRGALIIRRCSIENEVLIEGRWRAIRANIARADRGA